MKALNSLQHSSHCSHAYNGIIGNNGISFSPETANKCVQFSELMTFSSIIGANVIYAQACCVGADPFHGNLSRQRFCPVNQLSDPRLPLTE